MVRLDPTVPQTLTQGPHRSPLGLAGDPGGLPLYKNGALVGGLGVKAEGPYRVITSGGSGQRVVERVEQDTHGPGASVPPRRPVARRGSA